MMAEYSKLEQKLSYTFQNKALLEEALTHPSAGLHRGVAHYERLEFLGDRVLGLIIAQWLFQLFPHETEGKLARRHSNLVCRAVLAQIAQVIGIDQHIRLAHGERKSGGQTKASVLANTCEALIAALYLDGGLQAAEQCVRIYWNELIQNSETAHKDNKSQLQEWTQARGLPTPLYEIANQTGPQHHPLFTMQVSVEKVGKAQAQGYSKQEAAQKAAGEMLNKVIEWESANE